MLNAMSQANFNSRPREGATPLLYWETVSTRISIHAPARGRRHPQFGQKLDSYFNSRPREGATCDCGIPVIGLNFNSRPREGATNHLKKNHPFTIFQFTPPRGGDGLSSWVGNTYLFQFTPPRGGDHYFFLDPLQYPISIHAPARGRLGSTSRK